MRRRPRTAGFSPIRRVARSRTRRIRRRPWRTSATLPTRRRGPTTWPPTSRCTVTTGSSSTTYLRCEHDHGWHLPGEVPDEGGLGGRAGVVPGLCRAGVEGEGLLRRGQRKNAYTKNNGAANDGSLHAAWATRIAPSVSGVMQEFWLQSPVDYTVRTSGRTGTSTGRAGSTSSPPSRARAATLSGSPTARPATPRR